MRQAVKTAAAHSVSLPLDIKSGLLTAFFNHMRRCCHSCYGHMTRWLTFTDELAQN